MGMTFGLESLTLALVVIGKVLLALVAVFVPIAVLVSFPSDERYVGLVQSEEDGGCVRGNWRVRGITN